MIRPCEQCGQPYDFNKPTTKVCWSCWYSDSMKSADARFKPLRDAIARELEVMPQVWQTGGMTMCLAVPAGPLTEDGEFQRHVLLGEVGNDDLVGCSTFDDDGEHVDDHWSDIPDESGHEPEVAAWVAKIVLELAQASKADLRKRAS